MELPEVQALRRDLESTTFQLRKMHAVLMNARRHAYTASAMERCRAFGTPPRGLVEFRGQCGEDCVLYELFEGKQDGFFIEAGAFNGIDYSVSYAFEQLGWSGLLVEAIPQQAEECLKNRPNSRVVHAALVAPNAPATTSFTATHDVYGGMLSRRTDIADTLAPKITPEMRSTDIIVPTRTLDSLLEAHNGSVDFVALDLEGGEVDALKGFSLSRFRPRVLMIEDMTLGQNSAVTKLVQSQSYLHVGWVEMNSLFIRSDEPSLLARFNKMSVFGY